MAHPKANSNTVSTDSDPLELDHHYPLTRDFGLFPIPRHLRYDPQKPPRLSLAMNVAFGFFSSFSTFVRSPQPRTKLIFVVVSNLYYCHPLLSEFFFLSIY